MRGLGRLLLLASIAGGCGGARYVYLPAEHANASVAGRVAAHYAIPLEAPKGDVRIATFGTTEIEPSSGGPATPVLHVRMVVANNADPAPWTVDTREQEIFIPGEGSSRAAFVNASETGTPVLQVPDGGQVAVDLYYPLPRGMSRDRVPDFDFFWRVQTSSRLVAERTPFERYKEEPEPSPPPTAYDLGFAPGFGPFWWFDPLWPSATFVHPAIIVVPRGGQASRPRLRYAPAWAK